MVENFSEEREEDILKLDKKIKEIKKNLKKIEAGKSDIELVEIEKKFPNPKKSFILGFTAAEKA